MLKSVYCTILFFCFQVALIAQINSSSLEGAKTIQSLDQRSKKEVNSPFMELKFPIPSLAEKGLRIKGSASMNAADLSSHAADLYLDMNLYQYNESVICKWKAAAQDKGMMYTLQRSEDGQRWKNIAVRDAGRADAFLGKDLHPVNGMSYYRVKVTDLDGASKYSVPKALNFNYADYIIPHFPFEGMLSIPLGVHASQIHTMSIYDANGDEPGFLAEMNERFLRIDSTDLLPGVYWFSMDVEGRKLLKRIVMD